MHDSIQHKQEIYNEKKKRLDAFEIKAARYGSNLPVEDIVEIDSLRKELDCLQEFLVTKGEIQNKAEYTQGPAVCADIDEDRLKSAQKSVLPRAEYIPPDWLRYKLVAFDLDGTLLRGYRFSWTLVWEYLGYPKEVQKTGMRRYRRGKFTYKQWCDWACSLFINKNLTREQLHDIVNNVRLTKNFYETLRTLKSEHILTAIISGGIDTFVQDKIVDADKWFDYIFINRLLFDNAGRLSGVVSTDYDFDGKATALRLICEANDLKTEESVFVGEGFNDESIASLAGLSIAYPPTSEGLDETADVCIEKDDLSLILPHVLNR